MLQIIKKEIASLLYDAGVEGDVNLTQVPENSPGDVAYASFDYAKQNELDPEQAASELASTVQISGGGLIKKVEASGSYVNFFINSEKLAELLLSNTDKGDLGFEFADIGRSKKVIIEYPSQNSHKEFHIGHLRNVCIGNSLVKLLEKVGYEVVPVNYVNDFGRHVVKCLWGLKEFYKEGDIPENKQRFLGEIYAKANEYISKKEGELNPVLDELQQKLENKEGETLELFKRSREWSLEGFAWIFEQLSVKHSEVFFESELKDKGQEVVDELLQKGIAKVGEGGAIIVDLEAYGLGTALLRKSSGAGLYLTSDLALADAKFRRIKADVSVNITGTEQNLYFKQLFKVLQLAGFGKEMVHIGYGLVNTPEGKISSRSGNVILYEDLYKKVYERVLQEIKQRHVDWEEGKLQENTKVLSQAVLKFSMLAHEARKDFTFDFDKAVSFSGYSAPYVLYVVARINSIIEKFGQKIETPTDLSDLAGSKSKELLLKLASYPETIFEAAAEYNPSKITHYCFELAQLFNDFYDKNKILVEDEIQKNARLALCVIVKKVLGDALETLSIKTLKEM